MLEFFSVPKKWKKDVLIGSSLRLTFKMSAKAAMELRPPTEEGHPSSITGFTDLGWSVAFALSDLEV